MEPKFQSSFIPRGALSSSAAAPAARVYKERSLLGFVAGAIFILSVVMAGGTFGYGWYLDYSISRMARELEAGRAALDPEAVGELIALNDRIESAQDLLQSHSSLSPLFSFLESATLKNARFSDFSYSRTPQGAELVLRGEARGYSALVLQSQELNQSPYLTNISFSNLSLDERGNVLFSLKAVVDSPALSYLRAVERSAVTAPTTSTPAVSTSSPQAATSTSI